VQSEHLLGEVWDLLEICEVEGGGVKSSFAMVAILLLKDIQPLLPSPYCDHAHTILEELDSKGVADAAGSAQEKNLLVFERHDCFFCYY